MPICDDKPELQSKLEIQVWKEHLNPVIKTNRRPLFHSNFFQIKIWLLTLRRKKCNNTNDFCYVQVVKGRNWSGAPHGSGQLFLLETVETRIHTLKLWLVVLFLKFWPRLYLIWNCPWDSIFTVISFACLYEKNLFLVNHIFFSYYRKVLDRATTQVLSVKKMKKCLSYTGTGREIRPSRIVQEARLGLTVDVWTK